MNTTLWIIQGLLAAAFLGAGILKATTPKPKLTEKMAWANDFTPNAIKLIGVVEILGALGLVLPGITDIAPILTPLAATGLAITMALAIAVHVRRKERAEIVPGLVLGVLAVFVAVGRFGNYPL